MKNDLATAIIAAVTGVVLSYFICNMIVSNFAKSSYPVKTVDSSVSADLAEPNPEVFNYKALNPTVEVYVGNCSEVNMYGECVDASSEQIEEGIIEELNELENDETNSDENTNTSSSSGSQRNNQNGTSD